MCRACCLSRPQREVALAHRRSHGRQDNTSLILSSNARLPAHASINRSHPSRRRHRPADECSGADAASHRDAAQRGGTADTRTTCVLHHACWSARRFRASINRSHPSKRRHRPAHECSSAGAQPSHASVHMRMPCVHICIPAHATCDMSAYACHMYMYVCMPCVHMRMPFVHMLMVMRMRTACQVGRNRIASQVGRNHA